MRARLWNSTLTADYSRIDHIRIVSQAELFIPEAYKIQQDTSNDRTTVSFFFQINSLGSHFLNSIFFRLKQSPIQTSLKKTKVSHSGSIFSLYCQDYFYSHYWRTVSGNAVSLSDEGLIQRYPVTYRKIAKQNHLYRKVKFRVFRHNFRQLLLSLLKIL